MGATSQYGSRRLVDRKMPPPAILADACLNCSHASDRKVELLPGGTSTSIGVKCNFHKGRRVAVRRTCLNAEPEQVTPSVPRSANSVIRASSGMAAQKKVQLKKTSKKKRT